MKKRYRIIWISARLDRYVFYRAWKSEITGFSFSEPFYCASFYSGSLWDAHDNPIKELP